MIETIYCEERVKDHPRVARILQRRDIKQVVYCERYGEIFNRKRQEFDLQKKQPALILAKKEQGFLHPIPQGYGIGGLHNYYLSHLFNCPFDCRYCFLQGMFRSAHYVLFVNFEDTERAIERCLSEKEEGVYFFTGYDGDSLALEPVTHFIEESLPFFARCSKGYFEIRTKSIFIQPLLKVEPLSNCIVAYSLNPPSVIEAFEERTPPLEKRLQALKTLQQKGWMVGLRFDPVIDHEGFEEAYEKLFLDTFRQLDPHQIHSVTLGSFRLPKSFYRNMTPSPLLATLQEGEGSMVEYREERRQEMIDFCKTKILNQIPKERLFIYE